MSPFHKINLTMIALLAIPTLSGMAVARADEAPSVTVRYHDLNLNNPEGIANLYERIHAAAVVVCKCRARREQRESERLSLGTESWLEARF
jgi:UrcA family protein